MKEERRAICSAIPTPQPSPTQIRLPPASCFHPSSSIAVFSTPCTLESWFWLVIHTKLIMSDKKLMTIQSVNGYSNQLTTSNIQANSLAIHQTFSPKEYSGGSSRLANSSVPLPKHRHCLPHTKSLPPGVYKDNTLHTSVHSQWKPGSGLLFSWISMITANVHLMSSYWAPDTGKCWGCWGEQGIHPVSFHLVLLFLLLPAVCIHF